MCKKCIDDKHEDVFQVNHFLFATTTFRLQHFKNLKLVDDGDPPASFRSPPSPFRPPPPLLPHSFSCNYKLTTLIDIFFT